MQNHGVDFDDELKFNQTLRFYSKSFCKTYLDTMFPVKSVKISKYSEEIIMLTCGKFIHTISPTFYIKYCLHFWYDQQDLSAGKDYSIMLLVKRLSTLMTRLSMTTCNWPFAFETSRSSE